MNDLLSDRYKYLVMHGYDFPEKAKFKRRTNTVYTTMDFEDGEEITFAGATEFPSSNAKGYALYLSPSKGLRVVSIKDVRKA